MTRRKEPGVPPLYKIPAKVAPLARLKNEEWRRILDLEGMCLVALQEVATEKPPRLHKQMWAELQRVRKADAEDGLYLCELIRRLSGRALRNWKPELEELIYLETIEREDADEDYG